MKAKVSFWKGVADAARETPRMYFSTVPQVTRLVSRLISNAPPREQPLVERPSKRTDSPVRSMAGRVLSQTGKSSSGKVSSNLRSKRGKHIA